MQGKNFKLHQRPCGDICTDGNKKQKVRAGRKPSSVLRSPGVMIIYLGPRLLESTSDLPGSLGRAVLTPFRGTLPYAVLLQAGFSKHSRSPGSLVGSYPTVSPLPLSGRSSFLWHCPWGRPLFRFGTALPCGARTFLSPFPGSDHLTRSDCYKSEIRISKYLISSLEIRA